MLKFGSSSLANAVHKLFVSIIDTSYIPSEWKVEHKMFPLHKNRNISDASNYRPISLLCVLHKVLETVIYNKIIDFIYPKISKSQFGFIKNRSTLSLLLLSYTDVFQYSNKHRTDIVFLDFDKAFDSISHTKLLYGYYYWSWLFSKTWHYVEIDGCRSNLLPIRSGVPQGSVLGFLLFLVYVNDIPSFCYFFSVYMFADDTKLVTSLES